MKYILEALLYRVHVILTRITNILITIITWLWLANSITSKEINKKEKEIHEGRKGGVKIIMNSIISYISKQYNLKVRIIEWSSKASTPRHSKFCFTVSIYRIKQQCHNCQPNFFFKACMIIAVSHSHICANSTMEKFREPNLHLIILGMQLNWVVLPTILSSIRGPSKCVW